jgi:tetratricopeptide (TPR) repeat protein
MEDQVAALRAQLAVFEARRAPYSSEELALFNQPAPQLAQTAAQTATKTSRNSPSEMPAGSATLVAEAHRYFVNRQFDKAEERYLEVLRQDDKNVYTLANLAAIQLELNHLDEAERHVQQALAQAPGDAYSLLILGQVKLRQDKYDDSLDALSRAAKADPESPQIQNFLGVTLSHKGLRVPAETALRKAIELDPGYASAHNNLAVVYVTQQPPAVALARWHYQKALAAGHPRNPELEKMLDAPLTADSGK